MSAIAQCYCSKTLPLPKSPQPGRPAMLQSNIPVLLALCTCHSCPRPCLWRRLPTLSPAPLQACPRPLQWRQPYLPSTTVHPTPALSLNPSILAWGRVQRLYRPITTSLLLRMCTFGQMGRPHMVTAAATLSWAPARMWSTSLAWNRGASHLPSSPG